MLLCDPEKNKKESKKEIFYFSSIGCHHITENFLRNTSMPGVKFLLKEDTMSQTEWAFWFVSCVLALVLSGFLVAKVTKLQFGIHMVQNQTF